MRHSDHGNTVHGSRFPATTGHRQVVASSTPLIPVRASDVTTKKEKSDAPLNLRLQSVSSSRLSASRSACSLASHSEASLASPPPSAAAGGPDVLPTSVVARKQEPPDCTARRRAAPQCWCGPYPWWCREASSSPLGRSSTGSSAGSSIGGSS